MSLVTGLIVLMIFILDMFNLFALIVISPTGEIVIATLDVLTLMLFTIEVGINMVTMGFKHFFEEHHSRLDFAMVLVINSFYFGVMFAESYEDKKDPFKSPEDHRIAKNGYNLKSFAD